MFITVSGEKKEVKDGLSLEELIEQENVQTPQYVTVSLNDEFIETQDRDKIVLKDGDTVEFYTSWEAEHGSKRRADREIFPAHSSQGNRCKGTEEASGS